MKELLPGLLAWVKIGDDLFQIDEQLDNFIRATCGSSYRVELRKADTKWVVNNAMNGWGNNCYDEWMDKEVTLLYESPKEPAAPQTDAVGGNDFTLWVVVNRWEYVTERHEWVNNYIGELKGVSVKYKGLVEIFKQNK